MAGVRTKKSILIAAAVWLLILSCLAVAGRYVVYPWAHDRLITQTGSSDNNIVYKHVIPFGINSFSGYAPIRSEELKRELAAQSIKLDFKDDHGVSSVSLKEMQEGRLPMAVFTVDALMKSSADLGDMPGSIVFVFDETKGADAIVAYKSAVTSLQELNTPTSTFYLTPSSPSEFLARTVIASFNLPNMPTQFYTESASAEQVLRTMRSADRSRKVAYVLYQPYVSQALNDEAVHVLLDTSKLNGYILDVLVVERKYLKENPNIVRAFVEAYLRTSYKLSKQQDGYLNCVMNDARKQGTPITKFQAENVISGIVWKNTLENYSHFGLVSAAEGGNLPSMDRIINNIQAVLVKTNAMPESSFISGKEKSLYYDAILRDLQANKFHPDVGSVNIIDAATGTNPLDAVRSAKDLRTLSEDEWRKLTVVGEFRIDPITFGRGKSTLNFQAQRYLDEVASRLENFPSYYLIIVGNARSDGDVDIAVKLAEDRSKEVVEYLTKIGVPAVRMKSIASRPSGSSGEAQTVSFVVGQLPY